MRRLAVLAVALVRSASGAAFRHPTTDARWIVRGGRRRPGCSDRSYGALRHDGRGRRPVAKRGGGRDTTRSRPLRRFQLVLTAARTPIFFGLGNRGPALLEIVVMRVAIAATVVAFVAWRTAAGALPHPTSPG